MQKFLLFLNSTKYFFVQNVFRRVNVPLLSLTKTVCNVDNSLEAKLAEFGAYRQRYQEK